MDQNNKQVSIQILKTYPKTSKHLSKKV